MCGSMTTPWKLCVVSVTTWEEQVLSARGVQARRKPLKTRHMNGMEVRKKRPRGLKKRPRGFK